jgi:hypothetical protein
MAMQLFSKKKILWTQQGNFRVRNCQSRLKFMTNKIFVVSSIKKHKIRSTPAATGAWRRSAVEKQQHKSGKKKTDPPYFSVVPGSWQLNSAVVLLCIVATAVLYAGDLRLGFFRIDDQQYVVSNPWIQGLTWKHLAQILSSPYYLNYSPLHLLSYALDYAVCGLSAYGFHLSSNLWAGVVAGFVYLVALALTHQRITAVVAALLFVVHPAHVEAVAWISSRKDLVAAAFVLPCVLAYLKYRQRSAIGWYIVSLLLFLFALLGKLSVAAFPAVLVVFDLVLEKRPLSRSVIDKIPFLIVTAIVALAVQHAQPGTGLQADLAMHAKAFIQSLWLLTGLGTYVIYRVPPALGSSLFQLIGLGILLALFVLPWLLRKRYPVATVSIYWILFTYLPTQVLPFSYPVADRYLFLPSVGAVILIAWLLIKATDHLPRWKVAAATTLVAAVGFIWLTKTIDYLSEWRDPRSVWFAATRKSDDFHLYYELGWEYFEKAASFGTKRRNAPLPPEEAKHYASVVWNNDPRFPQLLSELAHDRHNGPIENAFKEYLQTKAGENFDYALARKGEHLTPVLFFSRGVFFVDKDDMQSAKKEFLAELDEASSLPDSEARQEPLISAYYNLAVVEERLGHSKEALSWIRLAEQQQDKLGRIVIPGLTASRQQLESKMATLPHE